MNTNTFENISLNQKKEYNIGIVVSRFNQKITNGLLEGGIKILGQNDFYQDPAGNFARKFQILKVPGAIEIPLVLQKLAKTKKFDALIALGAVIKGDTPHFDYVCKYVTEGILKISLENDIVVTYGVITTNNLKQAEVRSGKIGNKGQEAASTALEMLTLIKPI